MGDDDSLNAALSDKRIYMLDYSNLNGATVEKGVAKSESEGASKQVTGYSYMAIAIFAVSKETKS